MLTMSKRKPKPADSTEKRKRNVIFITLDDPTEAALQRFLDKQRITPEGFKPEHPTE
jgi:hypothetical protein